MFKPGERPELKPAIQRVIVRLVNPPPEERGARYSHLVERHNVMPWRALKDDFRGITMAKLFPDVEQNRFRSMRTRNMVEGIAEPEERDKYFVVECTPETDSAALLERLKAMDTVEDAYVESGPMPPPSVFPNDDPYFMEQGYLGPAPMGIDAMFAWGIAGGDGSGITVIDVEQGWNFAHEDLAEANVTLVHGVANDFHGHGTAVLGQLTAVDNAKGCVGIAPCCAVRVASQWLDTSRWSTAQAIDAAAKRMAAGDIMLIEAQFAYQNQPDAFLPVEVEDAVFVAIQAATRKGIVVVEAGGNGAQDLDAYRDPRSGHAVLNRSSADFRDSGAILVGAASAKDPRSRLDFSNYGSRIDCCGWGELIRTTGDGWRGGGNADYTLFSGTSGASPMIAGAAACVQGMFAEHFPGRRIPPDQMRQLLSEPTLGTPTAVPVNDRIGAMPDLRQIAAYLQLGGAPVASAV